MLSSVRRNTGGFAWSGRDMQAKIHGCLNDRSKSKAVESRLKIFGVAQAFVLALNLFQTRTKCGGAGAVTKDTRQRGPWMHILHVYIHRDNGTAQPQIVMYG